MAEWALVAPLTSPRDAAEASRALSRTAEVPGLRENADTLRRTSARHRCFMYQISVSCIDLSMWAALGIG
jgi:hypothetical protein